MKLLMFILLISSFYCEGVDEYVENLYFQYCPNYGLLSPITWQERQYASFINQFPRTSCCNDFVNNNQTDISSIGSLLFANAAPFIVFAFFIFLMLIYFVISISYYDKFHFKDKTKEAIRKKQLILPTILLIGISVGVILGCFTGIPWFVFIKNSQNRAFCQTVSVMNLVINGLVSFNNYLNGFNTYFTPQFQDQLKNLLYKRRVALKFKPKLQFNIPLPITKLQKFMSYLGGIYAYNIYDAYPQPLSSYLQLQTIFTPIFTACEYLITIEQYYLSPTQIQQGIQYFQQLTENFHQLTQELSNTINRLKASLSLDFNGLLTYYVMTVVLECITIPSICIIVYWNQRHVRHFLKGILVISIIVNFLLFSWAAMISMRASIISDGCNNINSRMSNFKQFQTIKFIPNNVATFFHTIFFPQNTNFYQLYTSFGQDFTNLYYLSNLILYFNNPPMTKIIQSVQMSANYVYSLNTIEYQKIEFENMFGKRLGLKDCSESVDETTLCGYTLLFYNYMTSINTFTTLFYQNLQFLATLNYNLDTSSIAQQVINAYETVCILNLGQIYQLLLTTWLLGIGFFVSNFIGIILIIHLEFMHRRGATKVICEDPEIQKNHDRDDEKDEKQKNDEYQSDNYFFSDQKDFKMNQSQLNQSNFNEQQPFQDNVVDQSMTNIQASEINGGSAIYESGINLVQSQDQFQSPDKSKKKKKKKKKRSMIDQSSSSFFSADPQLAEQESDFSQIKQQNESNIKIVRNEESHPIQTFDLQNPNQQDFNQIIQFNEAPQQQVMVFDDPFQPDNEDQVSGFDQSVQYQKVVIKPSMKQLGEQPYKQQQQNSNVAQLNLMENLSNQFEQKQKKTKPTRKRTQNTEQSQQDQQEVQEQKQHETELQVIEIL